MGLQPPLEPKRKIYIDHEELRIYLLWAFVLGVVAALWLCGCGPPGIVRSTVPPPPLPLTAPVPSRCRTVFHEKTTNVSVTLRHGCLQHGTSDVTFVVLNPQDDGSLAADDSAFILYRYFGSLPVMAPLAIMPTPDGNTAFIFVILDFSPAERRAIRRNIRLRRLRQ